MKKQKVSIITINYNNKSGLEKTIKSVISQTYPEFEYIVIDGGSSDGSLDVIKKYADKITYWVSEPDKGIYNAMNKGIMRASGEYCNFMNSGDCFYNYQTLEKIFSEHQTDKIITGITQMDASPKYLWYPPKKITFHLMYHGTISHQSSFIKTTLLKESLYDETIPIVADWAFFFKKLILDNCTYKALDVIVSIYDMTGVSSTTPYKEERMSVLKRMLPHKLIEEYEQNQYGYHIIEKYTSFNKVGKKILTMWSIILSFFFTTSKK